MSTTLFNTHAETPTRRLPPVPLEDWLTMSHPQRDAALKRGHLIPIAGGSPEADADADTGGSGGDDKTGDADADDGDGDDDGDDDDADGDDGDSKKDPALLKAERAAEKARKEAKRLRDADTKRKTEEAKTTGKFQGLYEESQERVTELEQELADLRVETYGRSALTDLGIKPARMARALRNLDLDDGDVDEAEVRQAAKDLKRDSPEWFESRRRSARGGGSDDSRRSSRRDRDDDGGDDDDDRDSGRRRKAPAGKSKLRMGLEEGSKRT